ncbi:unnamed protein product [Peronospora belbahrii]|uniref:Uncharacterized protein n=1 Tax=Peronospora belbahrii TaxID=622444 RepID=A0AAU9KW53_9STRA|nr:unnamed protein product [Peronospora belbahrii]
MLKLLTSFLVRILLMHLSLKGRDDLVGYVVDQTTALDCATYSNRTTVLHLTAMSKNNRVMKELIATPERKQKLQKIIDQTNIHGDTALMMACVAKSIMAVQLLLEMGANVNTTNASGLNALMCAARLGGDPRPGAPSIDERMEQSALIVKTLVANGADVNAVEKAGGNTALHLAVVSESSLAVESLISNARDLDITLRNEAGKTVLDLSKEISSSAHIQDLLSEKMAQLEIEAARMRAKVEQELMDLVANEARDACNCTQSFVKKSSKKKKKKKTKTKAQAVDNAPKEGSTRISTPHELNTGESIENTTTMMITSSGYDPASVRAQVHSTSAPVDSTLLETMDVHCGPWQSVISKNRRKDQRSSEDTKALLNQTMKTSPSKYVTTITSTTKPSSSSSLVSVSSKSDNMSSTTETVPARPDESVSAKESHCSSSTHWSVLLRSPSYSHKESGDETREGLNTMSYDRMNACFHQTFPLAAELEINVETFLIASSRSDCEVERMMNCCCLSVAQVEVLQESHWQAYHYLNEKKIELTRGLEAQRVKAQFELQQELMQFNS